MPYLEPSYLFDEPRTGWAYVNAVMLFPRGDLAMHESAMVPIMYDMIDFDACASETSVEAALRLAKHLRDAPRVPKRARREAFGALAGMVLRTVLRAAEHGQAELASVGQVLRCASQALRGVIARGASLENLEAIWRKYRPVSHFWAGLAIASSLEVTERGFLEFLAGAEELRRRGEAHKPLHGRQPYLNPNETWKVPEQAMLPSVAVSLPALSEDDLVLLGTGYS